MQNLSSKPPQSKSLKKRMYITFNVNITPAWELLPGQDEQSDFFFNFLVVKITRVLIAHELGSPRGKI